MCVGRVCGPESMVGAREWVLGQSRGEWGQSRRQWGQSRESVEHPDCLVEKTVFESSGFGPETLQHPPRWQQAEMGDVRWVGGVACNPGGFAGEASVVNIQWGIE